jgi:hypothetical protein
VKRKIIGFLMIPAFVFALALAEEAVARERGSERERSIRGADSGRSQTVPGRSSERSPAEPERRLELSPANPYNGMQQREEVYEFTEKPNVKCLPSEALAKEGRLLTID